MTVVSNLPLLLAERRLGDYAVASSELASRGRGANGAELPECETYLQSAIDAYLWLRRAEETMRAASAEGLFDLRPEHRPLLDSLYESWLKSRSVAEAWIADLERRGITPANREQFLAACEDVEERTEGRDWQRRSAQALLAAGSEEAW